ncbi:cytochrome-c oxidase, cbb3-type subunit I [Bdellovibrio svalbardensis]|uniref:cytochrome-c oxidase n=1 Tax=Bdellovibrio svalbardensis TaxID=2972972 RepID=A0ABT6DJI6_9BACT|nr:cytochrome-c oxidase, cbb3-type subunit I [Bdellovibrio svalbardensis]MDG0816016.1 cytochrome-c oxidase, cbb3-type subunit I [Bdellovibrio svalbardensis]
MNTSGNVIERIFYDDDIVKKFTLATMIWALAAFVFGLIAALQLAYWPMNANLEWITFGRLRPLHTNAAIFAFGGNAIFAGIYHSSQRLLKTRMFSDLLSKIHFWGWQLIIVAAAITLPLGYSQSKEYAELEWPIDIAIAVIWVVFAINFFMTIRRRREKHMYVAIWFYIATIITIAVLHIVNSIEIPVGMMNSYPVYAGIQDAMVQWWYGHNAVAFFLTTPFLGLMYYYVPKAANRPVYSYRLSIVHFWALVFIYIWAGPHHLLYTSLPEWAQTLGMIFSIMLWAPSWGGMINGLLTLKGSWHLLRTEPLIKFFVAALTFYGMSTFEGPLLSIKSVSALGHYTDWIVGHVHSGTLGWNGFLVFGMIYYLVPRLWKTELYSKKLLENHFWIGLTGVLLYYISMVTAGITQGLMWRAVAKDGTLVYPDFIETVVRIVPLYWVRALGGTLYIVGFLMMCYNIFKTIKMAPPQTAPEAQEVSRSGYNEITKATHRKLEGMGLTFSVLSFLAIAVGSVIEIYPTLSLHKYITPANIIEPYTPLELAGRDLYVKEGCYLCHSQQIRPIVSEVLRYGKASTLEESMYDHPFQWGSKRTGPDLARVGKKYPNLWHFSHMMDPRSITPKSIMPNYPWLAEKDTDFLVLRKKLSVMKYLGVPYEEDVIANADIHAQKQAKEIAEDLEKNGAPRGLEKKQIIALIAYLQSLGQKGKQ